MYLQLSRKPRSDSELENRAAIYSLSILGAGKFYFTLTHLIHFLRFIFQSLNSATKSGKSHEVLFLYVVIPVLTEIFQSRGKNHVKLAKRVNDSHGQLFVCRQHTQINTPATALERRNVTVAILQC